jgi:hypothetical protein
MLQQTHMVTVAAPSSIALQVSAFPRNGNLVLVIRSTRYCAVALQAAALLSGLAQGHRTRATMKAVCRRSRAYCLSPL